MVRRVSSRCGSCFIVIPVIWFIEVSSRFFGLTPTGSQSSQGSPAGTGSCGSGTAFGSVTWCWITLLPHDGSLVLTQILHYFHVFESSRGTGLCFSYAVPPHNQTYNLVCECKSSKPRGG
jgi:hypothetical protein